VFESAVQPATAAPNTLQARVNSRSSPVDPTGNRGAGKTPADHPVDSSWMAVCPASQRIEPKCRVASPDDAKSWLRSARHLSPKDEDAAHSPENLDFIFGRVITGNGFINPFNGIANSEDTTVEQAHPSVAPPPSQPLVSELPSASRQEWVIPSIAMEQPMPRRPEERLVVAEVPEDLGSGMAASPNVSRNARADAVFPKVDQRSATDAYREAMHLMWDYRLDAAKRILEPYRHSIVLHACAFAECSTLRVVLTGRKNEAVGCLDLIREAEQLRDSRPNSGGLEIDVCSAELMLMRCGLQVLIGSRFSLFFSLRRCWYAYRRLEYLISEQCAIACGELGCTAGTTCAQGDRSKDEFSAVTTEDLKGRVCFGLGLFYLITSMLPVSLSPLIRLAGFVIDRNQGKNNLLKCVEDLLGHRATLAIIVLSMYHLDLEPDIKRAGELLVRGLNQNPTNVLLHWASSLLAWRNADVASAVEVLDRALSCCDCELGEQAIYLRYELGMFQFMAMYWSLAYEHLRYVHDSINADKIFFPYRTLVSAQLAACCFSMGNDSEGEALCRAAACAPQDWNGTSRLEGDFAKVMQVFLKRRVVTRRLLCFEVMYLLRQLPRVPATLLQRLLDQIKQEAEPFSQQTAQLLAQKSESVRAPVNGNSMHAPQVSPNTPEMAVLVEHVSAQVMQCIILFYLGDLDQAMVFVPQLSSLCSCLPAWCLYLHVHGLYWCGRVFALSGQNPEAIRCLRQARQYKKYPFNISTKISKVLDSLEKPQVEKQL